MSKRYTIVMQVVEVDEHGDIVEGYEPMGPTWASTDLGAVRDLAAYTEDQAAEGFGMIAECSVTPLYPPDIDGN